MEMVERQLHSVAGVVDEGSAPGRLDAQHVGRHGDRARDAGDREGAGLGAQNDQVVAERLPSGVERGEHESRLAGAGRPQHEKRSVVGRDRTAMEDEAIAVGQEVSDRRREDGPENG